MWPSSTSRGLFAEPNLLFIEYKNSGGGERDLAVAAATSAGGNRQTENNLLASKSSVHQQQVAFVAGGGRSLFIYFLAAAATDRGKEGRTEGGREEVRLFHFIPFERRQLFSLKGRF